MLSPPRRYRLCCGAEKKSAKNRQITFFASIESLLLISDARTDPGTDFSAVLKRTESGGEEENLSNQDIFYSAM